MSNTTLDRETHTIHFQRSLAATREDVFDAWTQPEQLAAWWDPSGARLVRCEIDLRVGGAFTFVNAGHSPPFSGTYQIIERPAKLVFDALGSVGTVLLEAAGERTRMQVSIRCASAEHLQHFVELGVAKGTDQTLDNLVGYLDER